MSLAVGHSSGSKLFRVEEDDPGVAEELVAEEDESVVVEFLWRVAEEVMAVVTVVVIVIV